MTELKTLKDLIVIQCRRTSQTNISFFLNDLKAEAVKWIKMLRSKEEPKFWGGKCYMGGINYSELKFWIEHFFNLSEEDLK
jgi:hypothetical protein